MPTKGLKALALELDHEIKSVRALAAKAKDEGREFTPREEGDVNVRMERIDSLTAQIDKLKHDAELRNGIKALGGNPDVPPIGGGHSERHVPAKSWGRAVLEHYESKALVVGSPTTVISPGTFDSDVHGLGTPSTLLQSIIPSEEIRGDIVTYMQQTLRDSNAAAVAAHATKPVSPFTVTRREVRPIVIAHMSEAIARQDLADAPFLARFLDRELRLGLVREVDRQLLLGVPANGELQGLDSVSGIQAQTWDTDIFVTTHSALTKLREVAFVEPSHFVMSPSTWQRFVLAVDGNGRFMLEPGGAPVDRVSTRLWGLPVVLVADAPAGVAWAGDFGNHAKLFVREESSITVGTINDEFQKNELRVLAEGRWANAWYLAAGFVEIDLTSA